MSLKSKEIQTKKKRTIKSKNCFAGTDNLNYSCYGKKNLLKIAKDWNNYVSSNFEGGYQSRENKNPDTGQPYELIPITNDFSESELWNRIEQMVKKNFNCTNELCWSTLPFIRQKNVLLKRFKPFKPKEWDKNKNTWLNTTDIENVMEQYEERFPDFRFLGVSPIDYDYKFDDNECVTEDLCRLNIKDLYDKGFRRLGAVFNLDKHDESGSHWVSFYCDFNEREVYYYDSYGLRPPYDVRKLMKEISRQSNNIPKSQETIYQDDKGVCLDECGRDNKELFSTYYNDIRHQFKNSECGVYSMHFIISFLEGKTFLDIIKNIINDDQMNKNRDIYYQPRVE